MKKKSAVIGISSLALAVVIFLCLFIRQYQNLGDTIEKERVTYVSEIKNQLVENILLEKNIQMSMVTLYCHVIKKAVPEHFYELKEMLAGAWIDEEDDIFLMDSDGYIYNLDGERKNLSDDTLAQRLLAEGGSVFSYAQVNNTDEYWLYGEPLNGIILDGIPIGAILSARDIRNFSARMATGILDNKGFTYVASRNGNILVYPGQETEMGYNLFRSLITLGAEKETVERMEEDFKQGSGGQDFLAYGGNRWLISYSSDIFDDWVVIILMPMTITAADTYQMLNQTLFAVMLLVGSILALMLLLINLFYQKERERERAVQQEKMRLEVAGKMAESKNQFLAKMSHDIRTPLNAIMGLLKIIEGLVAGQPQAESYLGKLEQSAEYLLSILNDILDMSKIESGKMRINSAPFGLQDLLEGIEAMNTTLAAVKNLDFRIEVQGSPGDYYIGDRLRLNQILMNLISNAIKFTGEGGRVSLCVTVSPAEGQTDSLVFAVEDNGIGMSQEYLKNIFQPFEQENAGIALNYAGSGLGLSIVKNLVELMGGEIRVDSEKGRGSRFEVTLRLPRAIRPAADFQEREAYPDICLKGKKLLLAEDNELNAMIASELIADRCGMQAVIAENGQLALELFEASEKEEYAAILMDIRMPVMDGITATKAIRGSQHPRAAKIPIIAMSANAFQEDVALSLESGMNAHLSKPIDIDKLEKTLKIWVGKEGDA